MIEIEEDLGEIVSVVIDGERLDSDDGSVWTTPTALLRPYKVADMPEGVSFALCKEIQEGIVVLDYMPTTIRKIGEDRVHLLFEGKRPLGCLLADGGRSRYAPGNGSNNGGGGGHRREA